MRINLQLQSAHNYCRTYYVIGMSLMSWTFGLLLSCIILIFCFSKTVKSLANYWSHTLSYEIKLININEM